MTGATVTRPSGPTGGFAALVPEFDVMNLSASLKFWCDIIGFRVSYDRPEKGFAYLEMGRAQVMLCVANGNWDTGKLEHPFGRGINFQIFVEEITPILARLKAANWPLFRDVADNWYRIGNEEGGNREFLVQDPDGYLLRLSEDLGIRPVKE